MNSSQIHLAFILLVQMVSLSTATGALKVLNDGKSELAGFWKCDKTGKSFTIVYNPKSQAYWIPDLKNKYKPYRGCPKMYEMFLTGTWTENDHEVEELHFKKGKHTSSAVEIKRKPDSALQIIFTIKHRTYKWTKQVQHFNTFTPKNLQLKESTWKGWIYDSLRTYTMISKNGYFVLNVRGNGFGPRTESGTGIFLGPNRMLMKYDGPEKWTKKLEKQCGDLKYPTIFTFNDHKSMTFETDSTNSKKVKFYNWSEYGDFFGRFRGQDNIVRELKLKHGRGPVRDTPEVFTCQPGQYTAYSPQYKDIWAGQVEFPEEEKEFPLHVYHDWETKKARMECHKLIWNDKNVWKDVLLDISGRWQCNKNGKLTMWTAKINWESRNIELTNETHNKKMYRVTFDGYHLRHRGPIAEFLKEGELKWYGNHNNFKNKEEACIWTRVKEDGAAK